jgi:hypothetical protein
VSARPRSITQLRADLAAALAEFDLATNFYEVWRPAAFDDALHARMGVSYATNSFNVIRVALWRETLLCLCRLWDKAGDALSLEDFSGPLRHPDFMARLMDDRRARLRNPDLQELFRADLEAARDEVVAAISKYDKRGEHRGLIDRLRSIRGQSLAHRKRSPAQVSGATFEDGEVERLYVDTGKIICRLLHLLEATAFDPLEDGPIYAHYAERFWAAARGECTPGHPMFRRAPADGRTANPTASN